MVLVPVEVVLVLVLVPVTVLVLVLVLVLLLVTAVAVRMIIMVVVMQMTIVILHLSMMTQGRMTQGRMTQAQRMASLPQRLPATVRRQLQVQVVLDFKLLLWVIPLVLTWTPRRHQVAPHPVHSRTTSLQVRGSTMQSWDRGWLL